MIYAMYENIGCVMNIELAKREFNMSSDFIKSYIMNLENTSSMEIKSSESQPSNMPHELSMTEVGKQDDVCKNRTRCFKNLHMVEPTV